MQRLLLPALIALLSISANVLHAQTTISGTVVEQGSHAVLMALQGHYWRLHQAQFMVSG